MVDMSAKYSRPDPTKDEWVKTNLNLIAQLIDISGLEEKDIRLCKDMADKAVDDAFRTIHSVADMCPDKLSFFVAYLAMVRARVEAENQLHEAVRTMLADLANRDI